ncbi:hypothetical protein HETIRDRAFT_163255 [Heterobasidion irregulare TC 32-1]|uniref:Uncharacterized protein n=1 Tax=Heterobasidion irregulare (strain TC 32-1) TaxID=747525 RepID=W4KCQ9_HETIT|nr:uncharacterized protein HETIRDRAFT_163255 [Heterobasidion irregulare TC 32-1]ETW82841.1 hypothetical protein HETIRDRAFT_163255 [Heterobasidion irregulare TC 32-1]
MSRRSIPPSSLGLDRMSRFILVLGGQVSISQGSQRPDRAAIVGYSYVLVEGVIVLV